MALIRFHHWKERNGRWLLLWTRLKICLGHSGGIVPATDAFGITGCAWCGGTGPAAHPTVPPPGFDADERSHSWRWRPVLVFGGVAQ